MATTDVLAPYSKFLIKRPGNCSAFSFLFLLMRPRTRGCGRISCHLPLVASNPRRVRPIRTAACNMESSAMLTDENPGPLSQQGSAAKPRRRPAKARQSALKKLTPEELQTLRLDEASRSKFDALVQQFDRSAEEVRAFEGEDVASMDDARYDQRSAAEAELHRSGMAAVHFMAPRILKLRDGAAKRKWRSFLAKFRRDEKLG